MGGVGVWGGAGGVGVWARTFWGAGVSGLRVQSAKLADFRRRETVGILEHYLKTFHCEAFSGTGRDYPPPRMLVPLTSLS